MENKNYVICLKCGNVQARTDLMTELTDKSYAFVERKMLCPKCHKESQFVATKDIQQLRKVLSTSTNKTEQKICSYVRG